MENSFDIPEIFVLCLAGCFTQFSTRREILIVETLEPRAFRFPDSIQIVMLYE